MKNDTNHNGGSIIKSESQKRQKLKAHRKLLRKAARDVTASKEKSIRFLVSTGMYTKKGLKPKFR